MNSQIDIRNIKILWFGTPEISANVLERLINNNFNICGVVAQIDKPVGRKREIKPVPTKIIANKYNIPIYQVERLKNEYDFIKDINPDLILTLAYGQIVPTEVLKMPKYGCLNLHGSILPKYRGAAPIQFALLNGDKLSGVTLMEMVEKMDAGRIFYVKEVEIEDEDNYDTLTIKLEKAAYDCLIEGLESVISGENKGIEQEEDKVTFTKKILDSDQIIEFNDANLIHNKIRALNSNPGTYFIFNDLNYKVSKSIVIDKKVPSGQVYSYDNKGLIVGCGEQSICFLNLQKPGKKLLDIKDFYNGNRDLFKINEFIK